MSEEKKSFWTTLPGVLSGVAALLAAGATIFGLLHTGGGKPANPPVTVASFAAKANAICAAGADQVRALGVPSDPLSQLRALPDVIRIVTSINQQVQALSRPSDAVANAKIDRVLSLASQVVIAQQDALAAFNSGDRARAQALDARARTLSSELKQLDSELGANVCALGVG